MKPSQETLRNSAAPPACFVFNGDADGIISQHLRLLGGVVPGARITGLKRDIALLDRVTGPGPLALHVFDINVASNRAALDRLLAAGVTVSWYDHHEPGPLPDSPRFTHRIVTARGTCTGLIVHAAHPGQDPRWAAMAAFGDNVPEAAMALLAPLWLSEAATSRLREAGELLNYNAYGETPDDVLVPPLEVALRLAPFRDPEAFLAESGLIEPLRAQFRGDEAEMGALLPTDKRAGASLYVLPGVAWARRLGSTFANRAALNDPGRAVAVLHPLEGGAYQISLRAPRGRPEAPAASSLAGEYPSGGGRALAAGINRLPAGEVEGFVRRFFEVYG